MSPTVSVAMPAYQAAEWIGEALESVLGQTDPPDEVVVVDDGSTDGTGDIARTFGTRVRVVAQDNAGAPAAYNRAFAEAGGEYVAMCSADDVWEPGKLKRQRAALAADPEIDIAFAAAREFGLREADYVRPRHDGRLEGDPFVRELFDLCVIAAPSAVIRRTLHRDLGGFREDLPGEDYEFWLRAATGGATFFFDPVPAVSLRVHGSNLSGQALSMWEMNHRVHSLYASAVPAPAARRALARDLRTIGRCRVGVGQFAAAREAFAGSLRLEPRATPALAVTLLSLPPGRALLRRLNSRRQG